MMLTQAVLPYLADTDLFESVMALEGEVFRAMPGRVTLRVVLGSHAYFIKKHLGVGWREIFKNLLLARLPVTSAKNEWQALVRLPQLGIDTVTLAGYGCKGLNPATHRSFVMTEALLNTVPLDTVCETWPNDPPAWAFKYGIIEKVAQIARQMHAGGINHRDFYLCHFWLAEHTLRVNSRLPVIYLMDLHRAQIRKQVPVRWQIKDLSALYFSSLQAGLTVRDLFRFIRLYTAKPLRQVLREEAAFWHTVSRRARMLYKKALAKNLYENRESRALTPLL